MFVHPCIVSLWSAGALTIRTGSPGRLVGVRDVDGGWWVVVDAWRLPIGDVMQRIARFER